MKISIINIINILLSTQYRKKIKQKIKIQENYIIEDKETENKNNKRKKKKIPHKSKKILNNINIKNGK